MGNDNDPANQTSGNKAPDAKKPTSVNQNPPPAILGQKNVLDRSLDLSRYHVHYRV